MYHIIHKRTCIWYKNEVCVLYVRKPNRMVHTEIFSTKHYTNLIQQHLIKISYSDLTEATTWLYGSSNL